MPPPVSQTLPDLTAVSAKWRRSSQIIWLPVWKDWLGGPAVNSAGFLPPLPIYEPVSIGVYHQTKFKSYSDAEFNAELNALNSDPWANYGPYQCWISEIHTDGPETIGDVQGEVVHYVIRCIDREDGWKVLVPDAGYVYMDGTDVKSFMSTDSQPYIGNLDGSGGTGTTLGILAGETKKTIAFSTVDGL